jgi:hypothetical protein
MPRTVDHIVDTHRIAAARRDAGLPVWDRRINLADIWRNEGLTFEQRRDAIVSRLNASPWIKNRDQSGFDQLGDIVYSLSTADDQEEFNGWWGELYDHADIDRVWIATF